MNTQSTTTRRPIELRAGQTVVAWPDPKTPGVTAGTPGRWTLAADADCMYDLVRLDATDPNGVPVTWLLNVNDEVTVELTRAEQQAAAARVVARLADELELPEVFSWRIEDTGVVAQMSSGLLDDEQIWERIAVWAKRIGGTVTETQTGNQVNLSVDGSVDGVPVQVWTAVYLPAPAEASEVPA
ncbi:hypothetical protein [Thermomonospora amylolytica]|uniref:hypothetical protein n=1 Tax=Thermomonospora amylolytica TaxID=1411117 RepID=UPI000E6CFBA7|nr:hypothetical protein [Thermomonospora amylolytica]